MRIGLFTDTYRPSINGIVYVVDSTKRHLEALGHEVYVFCPARSIRPSKYAETYQEDDHIVRFPSLKGAFFDSYDTSLFFPPQVLRKIRELELDIIHFVTPGQVGLMGVYAAYKTNTPLVAQHCTDLREYVEHYPNVLPGLLALIALLPLAVKVDSQDIREIMKLYRPRRAATEWNRAIVERMVTLVYKKCDVVIALSRKSKAQLESWQTSKQYHYSVTLRPDGVDALPAASAEDSAAFRREWNIAPDDEVFGFVGRLGAEKNLSLLIPATEAICAQRPNARLLLVGDFEYRAELERLAHESRVAGRITFTGAQPRESLGRVYGAMDVFVFPSLTDTQGWAIHEAAHAGLPLVLIDTGISEVIEDGQNGYFADNTSADVAAKIIYLFAHPTLRRQFSERSRQLAAKFTERHQAQELLKLYEKAISNRTSDKYLLADATD